MPLALLASLVGTVHDWRNASLGAEQTEGAVKAAVREDARCQQVLSRIEDRRRKITLLTDTARANHFVLSLLGTLKDQTADAIVLASLSYGTERGRAAPTGEEPERPSFRLKGVATKRVALDASQELDEFVRRLRAAPVLARSLHETRLGTPTGERVEFQIDFTPSDSFIEERADGPAQGG